MASLFFFALTQWLEKKKKKEVGERVEEEEKESRSYHGQSPADGGGCESIDSPSDTVAERASSMAASD